MSQECRPTIRTRVPLPVAQEAEVLRKAMKGMGTDEAAIIKVLTSCSNNQRQVLIQEYKRAFDRDLIKDLKKELAGNFEDVVLALMTPTSEFLATELKHALNRKDGDSVVQIIFASDPARVSSIKAAYDSANDDKLEEDFDDEMKGVFEDVLIATVLSKRGEDCSEDVAVSVARAIYNDDHGVDKDEVVKAFSTLSFKQLRHVFLEYYKLAGRTLGEAFGLEFKGKEKANMQALVKCIENRSGYLAAALRDSMAGPGTNDRNLIRLVVSRSEVDLGSVKDEYFKMYNKTLEGDIQHDTSGDYKKVLLALTQYNY